MFNEPLKALIWAAVSTIEQADDDKFSLDVQIADAQAIADKNGWKIVDVIRIEGHSRNYRTLAKLAAAARSKHESGFDRLIAHLDACDFDVLICRDANRFARKASLLYEIVDTILEDCSARIYSLADGWVNTDNADMWLMVKGYEIRKQMKWISNELVKGRHNLVDEQGFPLSSSVVWSHKKVRDEKLKVVQFVPDETKTPIIEDAARLVIGRMGWNDIEERLFEDFGHGRNGKPFNRFFFYNLFHNPWFWGDAARNYNNPKSERGFRRWRIDPTYPAPEGVIIRRAVNPPAITGELAILLKAELFRRMHFRPRQHNRVHRFSGLLVCHRCGTGLVFSGAKNHRSYICQSKYLTRLAVRCERYWHINEKVVQTWLSTALQLAIDQHNPFYFVQPSDTTTEEPFNRIAQLQLQAATIEKQVRRLIEKQSAAPDAVAALYDEQIHGFGKQLETVQQRIEDETRQAFRYNVADIESAYRELTTYQSVEAFFEADDGIINQLLHRLLGNRRLTILDSQVVGTVEA